LDHLFIPPDNNICGIRPLHDVSYVQSSPLYFTENNGVISVLSLDISNDVLSTSIVGTLEDYSLQTSIFSAYFTKTDLILRIYDPQYFIFNLTLVDMSSSEFKVVASYSRDSSTMIPFLVGDYGYITTMKGNNLVIESFDFEHWVVGNTVATAPSTSFFNAGVGLYVYDTFIYILGTNPTETTYGNLNQLSVNQNGAVTMVSQLGINALHALVVDSNYLYCSSGFQGYRYLVK